MYVSSKVMGQMGAFHLYHIFLAKWPVSGEKKLHFIWMSMYLAESTNWGHYFYVTLWGRDRHFT